MTDLEMTKLCARAVGLEVMIATSHAPGGRRYVQLGNAGDGPSGDVYNPLEDDAQAMALVRRFRVDINSLDDANWYARIPSQQHEYCHAADLNRAIVTCVANMQAVKQREAA